MANKENELACASNLQEKIVHSNNSSSSRLKGHPLSIVASLQSSGFYQKQIVSDESDVSDWVSKDHETMSQVLFSRNLRLSVALTFWRKRRTSELIAYLVRMQDLGVVVDCLPVLMNSLQEEKPCISVGCCVDLLPLIKSLLKSQYEEYVLVGLNWLQAVIKRWWSQLSTNTDDLEDENIQVLKWQLIDLWKQEKKLIQVPGYTGNIAKDVDAYLLQLH